MLNDDEKIRINILLKKLKAYRIANSLKQLHYEGKNRLRDLGISIPPQLTGVQQAIGWSKVAVDTLNNRIMLDGYHDDMGLGINEIFDDNSMLTGARLANLDSLKFGIGYMLVADGDTSLGEPKTLVTPESPQWTVGDYNARKRRLQDAILLTDGPDKITFGTYLTETESIPFIIKGSQIFEDALAERVFHNMGRVPLVQIPNRPETGSWRGHSEITEPIISATQSMMRTMLGAEVAREFYSAPQRYILGADQDMFIDKDGRTKDALSVMLDRVAILPETESGQLPVMGQFTANSPAPYVDLMRFYANLFSSYTGLPLSYFGFETVNPTSEGAISAGEVRVTKNAENFTDTAQRAYSELAHLMILKRDGEVPKDFRGVPIFRDPRTPTRGQAADEVIKLVAANIVRPDSSIVYKKLGLTRAEIETIKAENAMATSTDLITRLRETRAETPQAVELVKTPADEV